MHIADVWLPFSSASVIYRLPLFPTRWDRARPTIPAKPRILICAPPIPSSRGYRMIAWWSLRGVCVYRFVHQNPDTLVLFAAGNDGATGGFFAGFSSITAQVCAVACEVGWCLGLAHSHTHRVLLRTWLPSALRCLVTSLGTSLSTMVPTPTVPTRVATSTQTAVRGRLW